MPPAVLLALAGLILSCSGSSVPPPTPARTPIASATGSPPPVATPSPPPTQAIPLNWTSIPNIPTPRSGVAATVFANTVFVIGGIGGPRAVERYIPISDAWKREPDLPVGVEGAMAAAIQGGGGVGIYVFGGTVNGAPSARAFHYDNDPQRGWQELEPMPAPRFAGAAVAVGRRIYIVGGAANDRALHNSIYVFDVDTRRWQIGPDIPTPRSHLAAVALGGRVCAVGGRAFTVARSVAAFECFDTARNAWDKLPAAPTARGGLGAAVVGGDRVIVVGGEQQSGTSREVEIFDAKANVWSRYIDLPTPRHGLAVAAVGNTVYALAGGPTPGPSQSAVCEQIVLR